MKAHFIALLQAEVEKRLAMAVPMALSPEAKALTDLGVKGNEAMYDNVDYLKCELLCGNNFDEYCDDCQKNLCDECIATHACNSMNIEK